MDVFDKRLNYGGLGKVHTPGIHPVTCKDSTSCTIVVHTKKYEIQSFMNLFKTILVLGYAFTQYTGYESYTLT